MDRQNYSQLELFNESGQTGSSGKYPSNPSLLNYIKAYEKTILITIGFVFISIVSFSLGVEKGKKTAALKNSMRIDLVGATPAEVVDVVKPKEVSLPAQIRSQGYVIQLASYKARRSAQQEAEILKKKGLSPLILAKGNYMVLCVGNFSSREIAQPLLTELKRKYRDCYIRRL